MLHFSARTSPVFQYKNSFLLASALRTVWKRSNFHHLSHKTPIYIAINMNHSKIKICRRIFHIIWDNFSLQATIKTSSRTWRSKLRHVIENFNRWHTPSSENFPQITPYCRRVRWVIFYIPFQAFCISKSKTISQTRHKWSRSISAKFLISSKPGP